MRFLIILLLFSSSVSANTSVLDDLKRGIDKIKQDLHRIESVSEAIERAKQRNNCYETNCKK